MADFKLSGTFAGPGNPRIEISWAINNPNSNPCTVQWNAYVRGTGYLYNYSCWEGSSYSNLHGGGTGDRTLFYNINGRYVTDWETIGSGSFNISRTDAQYYGFKMGGGNTSSAYSEAYSDNIVAGIPTGLGIEGVSFNHNSLTATVNLGNWRDTHSRGTNPKTPALSLFVRDATGYDRYKKNSGRDLSFTGTVDNSCPHTLVSLDILPNSEYLYYASATNGWTSVDSEAVEFVTEGYIENLSLSDIEPTSVKINYHVPIDGGVYNKYIEYSLDSGATWEVGDYVTTSNVDGDFLIEDLTPNTSYTVQVRVRTVAGENNVWSASFKTAHTQPKFSNFGYYDSNQAVVDVTGDNQVLIEGRSLLNIQVLQADKAVAYDGAIITKYVVSCGATTIEIPYADADVSGLIGVIFGDSALVSVKAYDSYGVYTEVVKSFSVIEWSAPTVEVYASRGGTAGDLAVSVEGSYSSIVVGGVEKNSVTARFRVLSQRSSEVVVDWTDISLNVSDGLFSGSEVAAGLGYQDDFFIEFEVRDAFGLTTASYIDRQEDKYTSLDVPEYTVELWGNQGKDYVADISTILVGGMKITCPLNDVEDLDFTVDLVQLEKRCAKMNVAPEDVLYPYVVDVRVKRNGKYVFGGQVVETNISIDEGKAPTIQVKCTGFLNLFKDQYIDESWAGYTYAELARKIVVRSQKSDNLIKNPTCDIDISYWLGESGVVSYSLDSHQGKGCLRCQRSSLTTWLAVGTGKTCPAGTEIGLSVWVKGDAGLTLNITEREYETISSTQVYLIRDVALTGDWQEVKVNSYTTTYENGYIHIECNNGQNLYVDDCYVYSLDDEDYLHNLNVGLGVDTASEHQDDTRERAYDLQNAKDAIVDLTNLEDDNFDFAFGVDRTFNCYARKGEDKLDIEAVYPGNISSMNISRSAADLANKIHLIGSGIGDERLEVWASDNASRARYGNRESVLTNSNVSLVDTLKAEAEGTLRDLSEPTNLPKITINDGSINLSNIEVGDGIIVRIEGDRYLGSINGLYRIMEISVNIDNNNSESLSLTLEAEALV